MGVGEIRSNKPPLWLSVNYGHNLFCPINMSISKYNPHLW